jgi:hypothetical protein
MAFIKKMTFIEYKLQSESLQLLEGNCLRLNDSKFPPIKSISSSGNDLKKLFSHVRKIRKDEFSKKFGRLVEIIKVPIQNSATKALLHFWNLEYPMFHLWRFRTCAMSHRMSFWYNPSVYGVGK